MIALSIDSVEDHRSWSKVKDAHTHVLKAVTLFYNRLMVVIGALAFYLRNIAFLKWFNIHKLVIDVLQGPSGNIPLDVQIQPVNVLEIFCVDAHCPVIVIQCTFIRSKPQSSSFLFFTSSGIIH